MNVTYYSVDSDNETEVKEKMSQETNLWQVQPLFSLLNEVKNDQKSRKGGEILFIWVPINVAGTIQENLEYLL